MKTKELFDLEHTMASRLLSDFDYPWQALKRLSEEIEKISTLLSREEFQEREKGVFVHKEAEISPLSTILPPAVIGKGTAVRPGAFIRGSVLAGENCVIGNSCEVKNSILFDGVQIPHFNYVGDSILGYRVHFGAGAVTSNVKSDKTAVVIKGKRQYNTNMKKLGALVGDKTEIGCNTVLNPGTVIGKGCRIYPLCSLRGTLEENSIYKSHQSVVKKEADYG